MTFKLSAKQVEIRDKLLLSPAKHALIYGGSRSGKTFLLCYAIVTRGLRASGSRHGIFRKHGVAVKQAIGADTLPKVMALAYPEARYRYYEQDGLLVLSTESEIWLGGLDDKERVDKVLGKEFATIYENEASEISYSSHTTLSTRLAQAVPITVGPDAGQLLPLKNYVDLNPGPQTHWTHKVFVQGVEPESKRPVKREDYVHGVMNPDDNAENLPPGYVETLKSLPPAQRTRFYLGLYSGDKAEALWTRQSIQPLYLVDERDLPIFKRIVVAIDPATTSHDGSNETGIIVAGIDERGMGHVLADASGVMKPEEWARKAVTLFRYYKADCVVAEVNQGGEMVRSVIQSVSSDVSVKMVHASRGKYVRAEPIAALYARGRVVHVGGFETLEDQMCNFTVGLDRKDESPDRVDALVWALTELFPGLVSDLREDKVRQTVADSDYDPLNRSRPHSVRQATAGMNYTPF